MSRSTRRASGWRIFLKPGWVITAVLAIAFSYFAITVLSPWQLNKDHDIVARNKDIEQAFDTDPSPITDLFDSSGNIKGDNEWMRATLTGRYLPDKEVLLRMRPVDGSPAYQSLVPFQSENGQTLLVNRGFIPLEAGKPPRLDKAPSGVVTIVGHARHNEGIPATPPLTADGYTQVNGISTEQISTLIDAPLGVDYLQLASDQPGEVHAMPIPKLDRGNHLSYGFQWIAFGVMAPLAVIYFVWAEIKERRRAKEEEAQMQEAAPETAAENHAGITATASRQETETKTDRVAATMRSRYGSTRSTAPRKRDHRRDNF